MPLTGAERAKRSRTNKALREIMAPMLVAEGWLNAADVNNRKAIEAAKNEFLMYQLRLRGVTSDAT